MSLDHRDLNTKKADPTRQRAAGRGAAGNME
jgi:hypothetical protein